MQCKPAKGVEVKTIKNWHIIPPLPRLDASPSMALPPELV